MVSAKAKGDKATELDEARSQQMHGCFHYKFLILED